MTRHRLRKRAVGSRSLLCPLQELLSGILLRLLLHLRSMLRLELPGGQFFHTSPFGLWLPGALSCSWKRLSSSSCSVSSACLLNSSSFWAIARLSASVPIGGSLPRQEKGLYCECASASSAGHFVPRGLEPGGRLGQGTFRACRWISLRRESGRAIERSFTITLS